MDFLRIRIEFLSVNNSSKAKTLLIKTRCYTGIPMHVEIANNVPYFSSECILVRASMYLVEVKNTLKDRGSSLAWDGSHITKMSY